MDQIRLPHLQSPLKGQINTGGSKSISNRLLIIDTLGRLDMPFENISDSDDTRILKQLLHSRGDILDCGKAGTTLRFLLACMTFLNRPCVITGDERMLERPVGPLADALTALGAKLRFESHAGYPPVRILPCDGLKGRSIQIDASVSSQFLSALALIAPCIENGLEIIPSGKIVSGTYLDMTLDLMTKCGIQVERDSNHIRIFHGPYQRPDYVIESDWSSASYYYALCSLVPGSEIKLKHLRSDSLQGDSVLAKWMEKFGVSTQFQNDGILIRSLDVKLAPVIELDLINHPDLFQTFAFFFAVHGSQVLYTGLDTLKDKETDRIIAVKSELKKVGVDLVKLPAHMSKKTTGSVYFQEGKANFDTVTIETYNDHRMAMAASILSAAGEVEILNPGVVAKSYPAFFSDLQTLAS